MTVHPSHGAKSAFSSKSVTAEAVAEIGQQLGGVEAKAVFFFTSHHHDGSTIGSALRKQFAGAQVIGCTTAGEFTSRATGTGGISAFALGKDKVVRCAAALARCERGVEA